MSRFVNATPVYVLDAASSFLLRAYVHDSSPAFIDYISMATLTKADLAELLFEKVGLNKREAKDVVESFFDEIRLSLEKGDIVNLDVEDAVQKLINVALRQCNAGLRA